MGTCTSLPSGGSNYEQKEPQPYELTNSSHQPLPSRQQQHPTSKGGLVGLVNLGNTCFMNSALQCLSNTPPLTKYFLSSRWREEINSTNPIGFGGDIASSFGELIVLLWAQEQNNDTGYLSYSSSGNINTSSPFGNRSNTSITPKNFKSTLGRYFNQFSGYEQHDSQELLTFLLDGLHEDLNRVKKKPYIEDLDSDDNIDEMELADRSWCNYLLRNRSIIVDLAQGQLKSKLKCLTCGHTSIKFDPYMHLSLPVDKNSRNKWPGTAGGQSGVQ